MGRIKACSLSRDNTVYRRESVCGSLSRDNTVHRWESVCGSLSRDNTVYRRESVCGSLSRDNTVYRRESVCGCVKAWSRVTPTSWPGPETPTDTRWRASGRRDSCRILSTAALLFILLFLHELHALENKAKISFFYVN